MPDHPDPPVSRGTGGGDRRVERLVHGMKLVVSGQLLDQAAVRFPLEHHKVGDKIQQVVFPEDPLCQDLDRGTQTGFLFPFDRSPGGKALPVGRERANTSLIAVGDHQELIEGEEGGDLFLVGLKLVEGRPDRGLFVSGIFELNDSQRDPVHEDHDIGPPVVVALHDGQLVDHHPVVVVEIGKVEKPGRIGDDPIPGAIFDGNPFHKKAVEGVVSLNQGGGVDPGELPEGFLQRFRRKVGIETGKSGVNTGRKERIGVGGAFGLRGFRGDLRTMEDRVS